MRKRMVMLLASMMVVSAAGCGSSENEKTTTGESVIETTLAETEIEQNRCAMACQGCVAVFYFYLKRQ